MLSWIALASILGGLLLLLAVSYVDIKTRKISDEVILGLVTLGIIFHLCTLSEYISVLDMLYGTFAGFSILFIIGFLINRATQQDVLDIPDLKLMGAAGLWLGLNNVIIALALGTFAFLCHAIAYTLLESRKTETKFDLSSVSLPAGPGFSTGIIIAAAWGFKDFFAL
jgi:leader peptidase (prepilin peptidase)/N-methyltransferase